MSFKGIPVRISSKYGIHKGKQACAILKNDFSVEWTDISALLDTFQLKHSWIAEGVD